jgi:glycosyltransferase involved in cell wall biosynthesis
MTEPANLRVMWLLNHTAARPFELAMLKQVGVREIFLPKSHPPEFRSASIDYSEDAHLTIPAQDLEVLNAADWYVDPGKAAWKIADRHFDALFFILDSDASLLKGIARYFRGVVLWRAFGLLRDTSYSTLLQYFLPVQGERLVQALGRRFFFAQAYPHLHQCEGDFMQRRQLFLPLGLPAPSLDDRWRGNDKRVFFVCPDIGYNEYYRKIYLEFLDDFKDLPYAIGGAQLVPVRDRHVLGYLPRADHERNMREMRTMFYHSSEPNHVHYHPFEAVRAGMPLLFMAGGLLDRLGGSKLPGRCTSIRDARKKMAALLAGDRSLIDAIRVSQPVLLDAMRPEGMIDDWRAGFAKVREAADYARQLHLPASARRPRIAVMVPIGYRGGTLRAAKLLARAIDLGARRAGKPVDVVFAHLDDPACYSDEDFRDLPAAILRRPFKWKTLARDEAALVLQLARQARALSKPWYQAPDDGIQQFADCDLWMIVSDQLELPLLPLRPYAVIVYDYLRRYLPLQIADNRLHAVHGAERVLCTTDFTYNDALQFAGLDRKKVVRVPMLAPEFSREKSSRPAHWGNYFLWTTNLAAHKNHENAIRALQIYYERLDGQLNCHVTGVGTDRLLTEPFPHLQSLPGIIAKSPKLKNRLRLLGELPDPSYRARLAGARFLWHAASIDNGSFSVIEAAYLGVPALSSMYPAMQEINSQYLLGLNWMDAHDPNDMAIQLKHMESKAAAHRATLPSHEHLMSQRMENLAEHYWKAVEDEL